MVKPIARGGREHVDYVPTQIATEYFRRVYTDGEGNPLHGIIDFSSGHLEGAFVLLCEKEQ